MIKCNVKVKSDGKEYVYPGLFKTTADAVTDALKRFMNVASVFVRPL